MGAGATGSDLEATFAAAGVMLSGLGEADFGVEVREAAPPPIGVDLVVAGAVCHAGKGADSFFLVYPSLHMKQELLPQPVSNAGMMDKPTIQGFMFTRHLLKAPDSRTMTGRLVRMEEANSPEPRTKQGGFCHSVQR